MKTLKGFHLLWNKKTQWGKKTSGKWVWGGVFQELPQTALFGGRGALPEVVSNLDENKVYSEDWKQWVW